MDFANPDLAEYCLPLIVQRHFQFASMTKPLPPARVIPHNPPPTIRHHVAFEVIAVAAALDGLAPAEALRNNMVAGGTQVRTAARVNHRPLAIVALAEVRGDFPTHDHTAQAMLAATIRTAAQNTPTAASSSARGSVARTSRMMSRHAAIMIAPRSARPARGLAV